MQKNDADTENESQTEFSTFFSCLPGFESVAAETSEAAKTQAKRRHLASRLAFRLTGRNLDWIQTEDSLDLVDTDTGEIIAGGPSETRPERYAHLLLDGARPENHVSGVLDDHGTLYPAGTALVKHSLRLDPNWAETLRRRSRQVARRAVNHAINTLPPKEHYARRKKRSWRLTWKLVTLTMPHWDGMSTEDAIRHHNRAFKELGKTKIWDKVYAGVKGIEDKLTAKGPHVHSHNLLLSRYIDKTELREAWGKALSATRSRDQVGPQQVPFIDIRLVSSEKGGETITLEDALSEVSKYITKTADLVTPDEDGHFVPAAVLLEQCEIARWPRMFELLGACRASRAATLAAERARLDTSCISPGLDNAGKPESMWTESLEPEEKAKFESMGINFWDAAREPEPKKPPRPPSWRDLMFTLSVKDWLQVIAGRAKRAMRFRLTQLSVMNPSAFLVDMTGKIVLCQHRSDEIPCDYQQICA